MEETDPYLYRGTTRGWPGNPGLQDLQMTCTTTDPLVATLFAIECLGHGEGIVYLAPRAPLERWAGPPNCFDDLECAVNIKIKPTEFLKHVQFGLHPHRTREILMEMGFVVPYLINGSACWTMHSRNRAERATA